MTSLPRKYRKGPSPLCALSNLSVFVVKRWESCAFMMRKTPISTTGRFKTPDNPARGRYRTDWLADANATLSSEAQFHGFLEENPDAVVIVDQTGRINFASNRIETMLGHLPDELV